MKRNLVYGAILVIFVSLGFYYGTNRLSTEKVEFNASGSLFGQTLANADGHIQPLSKWQGKPLLVNFWATWCSPCVEEMPELSALQDEMASKNIHIIGIGIDSASNIREFLSKYKISYPLYIAGMNGTNLLQQFGNRSGGLPFTVLIDSDGQVKQTYLGRLKIETLRQDLALLK
jgi:thiol-disulfide isomerase/thioredoxin